MWTYNTQMTSLEIGGGMKKRDGTLDVGGRCSVDGRDRGHRRICGSMRERSALVDGAFSTAGTVNSQLRCPEGTGSGLTRVVWARGVLFDW